MRRASNVIRPQMTRGSEFAELINFRLACRKLTSASCEQHDETTSIHQYHVMYTPFYVAKIYHVSTNFLTAPKTINNSLTISHKSEKLLDRRRCGKST